MSGQPAAGSRTPAGAAHTGRRLRVVEVIAVATAAAFAAGALLSQTVVVPTSRAMDPAAFLRHFSTYGPVTGGTVFPFAAVSAVLLCIAAYASLRHHRPGRVAWVLAAAAMLGTLVLLPIYFVHANLAMLRTGFPPGRVHAELAAWNRWNWVRTGLGLFSAACACVALGTDPGGDPARRP